MTRPWPTTREPPGWGPSRAWLRLVRSGSTFTPYYSTDGASWVQGPTGPSVISMPADILVGMALTNVDLPYNNHVVFDNVAVTANCPTFTASPTPTPTFSASPSPSASPSASPSPTTTRSFTASPSPSVSPAPTQAYASSGLGRTLLAPVPALSGRPLCVYFDGKPRAARLKLYDLAGNLKAKSDFGASPEFCVETAALATGIYLAWLDISFEGGRREIKITKVAVMR